VVIGSGPGGSTAALFLAQAGVNVLLLEAGSEHGDRGLTFRLGGMTLAKRRRTLTQRDDVVRSGDPGAVINEDLSPGGLSNHWSCAVPRFSHEDFEDAVRAGEQFAWPLGYDELAPWYDRVEPLLHIAGTTRGVPPLPAGKVRDPRELHPDWQAMVDAAERAGRAVVAMPYAYGGGSTVTLSGTVFNAFVRLAQPLIALGSIRARYDARALRLQWSADEQRVVAIEFLDTRTGQIGTIPCRAVIVAAGAANSAELLLASKSGSFPEGLGNTHGVLGKYLHDHPLGKLVIDLARPVSVHPASYVARLSMDRSPPLYAAAGMQWSGASLFAQSMLKGRPGRLPWVGYSVFGTMAPTTDNWVALAPSKPHARGHSALDLHITHPPEAIRALEQARDQILELLGSAGLGPSLRIWHVEPPGNSTHYGGTCRMHASPRFGVIDRWSRIHGVRNVAVADSSAFTTGPEKNPVLTSMALSARAASRLAEDLRSGAI
jgi:choline dehydrogenase-like flavoprotein